MAVLILRIVLHPRINLCACMGPSSRDIFVDRGAIPPTMLEGVQNSSQWLFLTNAP